MSRAPHLAPVPAERTQPHNLEAEKSVLGAVFIKPAALAEIVTALQVDDFFLPAHREIFAAMLAVDNRRQPVDVLAVGDELRTRGMMPRLDGGETYLLALANGVPTAEHAAHYARIVAEKAALRRLIAACADVQSSAYGDFGEFQQFVHGAAGKVAAAVDRAAGTAWISTVERALALGAGREPLPTGFRSIDADTRGGLRPGVVVIGGAPGSGKTSWAVQYALRLALQGIHVVVVAADEEPSGILIRIGQGLGLARDDLERGRPEVLASFAARLAEIPTLILLDGADATIEAAARELKRRAGAAPAVLIVDSVQTARAMGSEDADGPRARIDVVVAALKRAGRDGLVVLATCELARGAYRSKSAADRSEALAAFKESGSIEYGAHVAVVLTSVKGETGVVDVEVAKNRWGAGKTAARWALNFATASFHETALNAAAGDAPGDPDVAAAYQALEDAGTAGVAGLRGLCEAMPPMSRARKEAAARRLRDDLRVVLEEFGPRNSVRWRLSPTSLPGVIPESSPGTVADESSRDPFPLRGEGSQGKSRPEEVGTSGNGGFPGKTPDSEREAI